MRRRSTSSLVLLMALMLVTLAACDGELKTCSEAAGPGLGKLPEVPEGVLIQVMPSTIACIEPNSKVLRGTVSVRDRDKLVGDVVMIARLPRAASLLDWDWAGFTRSGQALSEAELKKVLESAAIGPKNPDLVYPEFAGTMSCGGATPGESTAANCSAEIEYSASGPIDDLRTTEIYFIAFGKDCREVVRLQGVDQCRYY